jgi:hypothetical protein
MVPSTFGHGEFVVLVRNDGKFDAGEEKKEIGK